VQSCFDRVVKIVTECYSRSQYLHVNYSSEKMPVEFTMFVLVTFYGPLYCLKGQSSEPDFLSFFIPNKTSWGPQTNM